MSANHTDTTLLDRLTQGYVERKTVFHSVLKKKIAIVRSGIRTHVTPPFRDQNTRYHLDDKGFSP